MLSTCQLMDDILSLENHELGVRNGYDQDQLFDHMELQPVKYIQTNLTASNIYGFLKEAITPLFCPMQYRFLRKTKDLEAEQFFDDISTAKSMKKAHFAVVIGDFNAKVRKRNYEDTGFVGSYGVEERNNRGNMFIDFLSNENVFSLNRLLDQIELEKPRQFKKK
ncbi:hypothetical protein HUJ04_000451 [Dendroctonus ponderosae]|nr:hypothetical protein HUJ04_000451 [Dendroctonus ponderosae]